MLSPKIGLTNGNELLSAAGAVMAEVARDPDVIALAHEPKAHGQRAGPYLIQVINVGE